MSNNPKFDELLQRMQSIHSKKEADYTGDKDPHFNFRFSADFAANFENRIDKPYAYLIGTKIARLISLLEKDNVVPQNEPLEDTFVDLANYFLLWASRRAAHHRTIVNIEVPDEF